MTLLDRYIFKSVFVTCVSAVGLFAFVLVVGNVMKELMGALLAGQVDVLFFIKMWGYILIFVIPFALPMGILTGIMLTLGRLSADSEVTAMRSAGLSLLRVSRPILIMALLGAMLALYINHEAMPWARVTYRKELSSAIRSNPLSFLVPRTFIRQFPGVVVYLGEKKGSKLSEVWVWQLDREQRVTRFIKSDKGTITYNEAENELVLTLQRAQIEGRRDGAPEDFTKSQYTPSVDETEAVRLNLDRMFQKTTTRTKLDFLPYDELQREQGRLSIVPGSETPAKRLERERTLTRIDLVISERFNNAFAVLTLSLIGIPLGIRVSRRETSANLGVAVGLALAYYFCTTAIGWLEKSPEWNPDILLYAPNLMFLAMAVWLFARVEDR